MDGFCSASLEDGSGTELGRSKGGESPDGAAGLSTGVTIMGFATETGAATDKPSPVVKLSSSVRFNALSIADIATETGSGAEFCFAIVSASLLSAVDRQGSTNANSFPGVAPTGGNAPINHVAVYRRASNMKTAWPADPSNVVNASFTIVFSILSRL
jgi:hypothetical protein